MFLSESERIEILMMVGYGDRKRSYREVCELFHTVYPNRPQLTKSTVARLVSKFTNTGFVKDRPRTGRPKTKTSDEEALNVLLSTIDNPQTSTTQLAADNNSSQSSVRRILAKNKYKPYKVHLLQELSEDDPDRRIDFCERVMDESILNPNFPSYILFSDEATFCLNGFVNRHNCRYWSNENPNWMMEHRTQYPQKLNVWAGIIGGNIIGPFFINGNLTGEKYYTLLRTQVIPQLALLYPNVRNGEIGMIDNRIWFQQDGAPPHYTQNVREYLNQMFPNRWIGRRGTIEWPPRSPDLNPLDFFLWGHLKTKVYKTKPNTLADLEERIRVEIGAITPNALQNTVREFTDRLGHCQVAEGRQFEHLLK